MPLESHWSLGRSSEMFFLFVGEMEVYKVTENVLYRWLSTSVHIRFASVNISKVEHLLKHLVVRNNLLNDFTIHHLWTCRRTLVLWLMLKLPFIMQSCSFTDCC